MRMHLPASLNRYNFLFFQVLILCRHVLSRMPSLLSYSHFANGRGCGKRSARPYVVHRNAPGQPGGHFRHVRESHPRAKPSLPLGNGRPGETIFDCQDSAAHGLVDIPRGEFCADCISNAPAGQTHPPFQYPCRDCGTHPEGQNAPVKSAHETHLSETITLNQPTTTTTTVGLWSVPVHHAGIDS